MNAPRFASLAAGFWWVTTLGACAVSPYGYGEVDAGYYGGVYEPYGYDYGGWDGGYRVGPPRDGDRGGFRDRGRGPGPGERPGGPGGPGRPGGGGGAPHGGDGHGGGGHGGGAPGIPGGARAGGGHH
jgi:hypothetical protein